MVLRASAQRPFVEWLSTWGVWLDTPGDLGFQEEAKIFELPPLHMKYTPVDSAQLIDENGKTLTHRIKARKATLGDRVKYAARLVNEDTDQDSPWVIWASTKSQRSW